MRIPAGAPGGAAPLQPGGGGGMFAIFALLCSSKIVEGGPHGELGVESSARQFVIYPELRP